MDAPAVILAGCLGGIVAGLWLLWRGLGGYRTAVAIGDTSTSQIDSLAAGEVRVTGVVEAAEVTLVSPLQSVPCVWYRASIRSGGDDDREVFADERGVGFRVRDAGGSIRVFPRGARLGVPDRFHARSGLLGDPPPGLNLRRGGLYGSAVTPEAMTPLDRAAAIEALLTVRPATPSDVAPDEPGSPLVAGGEGRREYVEARLEVGDTVTVVGTALPFGHLPDPFGADRMDRASDPLTGLEDPEVAAQVAAARAAGTLLTPEEAWGNAAIPGFGIGRPVRAPELDPDAHRPVIAAEEAATADARNRDRFHIPLDTLVIAAAEGSSLLIAEGAPGAAVAREQGRFLVGLLGAALAVASAAVAAVVIGGLPA